MKFRKKPVVIEAERCAEVTFIETLEGTMRAEVGDWIITGVKGERYPCKPDIFDATYEAATGEAAEARAERYRKALKELVGILEIAAVMPEAIHKQMFVSWDDPALERARAALRGEG